MAMSSEYTHIPIIDWTLSQGSPEQRSEFLDTLRSTMINIGFLYLKNHPVPKEIVDAVVSYTPKFFDLPRETKDAIDMVNCPHFHGYLRVGEEGLQGVHRTDEREQFNFAGNRKCRYQEGEPEYLKLHGDALWPNEDDLPGFRAALLTYYSHVEDLSYKFTSLVAEALGLSPTALDVFFEEDRSKLQPRCKLMKYPPAADGKSTIGIGAHIDGSILTFLLQASNQAGLEVLNRSGAWVPAPPIEGTFVINLGRALEKVTRRVAIATSHRVMSPVGGPRYSVAFFSSASMHVRLADHPLEFPQEVLAMKDARDEKADTKVDFKYTDNDRELAGIVTLNGKIKNHPDIAEKFYPTLFKQFFPEGRPLHHVAAY